MKNAVDIGRMRSTILQATVYAKTDAILTGPSYCSTISNPFMLRNGPTPLVNFF
jgi:hypothetical protein